MEILMTHIPKSPTLRSLQDERRQFHGKLEETQAALNRAAANVTSWTVQQAAAERGASEYELAQAEQLANTLSGPGPEPQSALPSDNTKLVHARLNLSVAMKAQASLAAAHQAQVDKLAGIERDIAAEADKLLDQRREAQAHAVERSYAKFMEDVATLRDLTPDHLHTPVNVVQRPISQRVLAALTLLPTLEDGIHTPINQLRGQLNSAALMVKLRAALIADDIEKPEEANVG